MASGFNFIEPLVGHDAVPIASGILAGGIVVGLGVVARKKLTSCENPLVPEAKLTIRNFAELLTLFVRDMGDSVMGKENRKYIPLVASLFIFILVSNLLGLIPGFVSPTSSVTFNFGMALVVFILYNAWGIKEVGFLNYIKHFGMVEVSGKFPVWLAMAALWVFICGVELISHVVRPVSLSIRLYGNMVGDHAVLSVFTDMIGSYGLASIFYFMGTLVSVVQAFIFTVLTMIYIKLSCSHEEH